MLRVVRGDATPEEIAALVAVIGALGGGEAPGPPAYSRVVGTPPQGSHHAPPRPRRLAQQRASSLTG